MTSLDLSHLSGADAVAALRSYPRRYRSAVLPVPDDLEAEELAGRVGPTGHSAIDLIVHATNTWVLIGQALHQVLIGDDPVLHPGIGDAAARDWELPPGIDLASALERLGDEASTLADAVDRVEGAEWNRTGQIAGGGRVTALDLAKAAVGAGAADLHAIETTLAALRTQ